MSRDKLSSSHPWPHQPGETPCRPTEASRLLVPCDVEGHLAPQPRYTAGQCPHQRGLNGRGTTSSKHLSVSTSGQISQSEEGWRQRLPGGTVPPRGGGCARRGVRASSPGIWTPRSWKGLPADVQHPNPPEIPSTRGCSLHGRRDSADGLKLKISRWEGYPGGSSGAPSRGRQEGPVREAGMPTEVGSGRDV